MARQRAPGPIARQDEQLIGSIEHERRARREAQFDDRSTVGSGDHPRGVVHGRDRANDGQRKFGAFRLACGSLNDRGLNDRGSGGAFRLACGSLNDDRGLDDRVPGAPTHAVTVTRSDATARGGSVTVSVEP